MEYLIIALSSPQKPTVLHLNDYNNSVYNDYVYNDIPVIAIEFHGPGRDFCL